MTPTVALLRFHLGSGTRLAMHAGVPAAALLTVAVGLSGSVEGVMAFAADDLATGSVATAAVLVAIGAGIAAWGAPRIAHGIDGLIGHLRFSG